MGYSFIGTHRKTDDKNVFYEECMYVYEPVFKKCFGKDISEFSGRVTKKKIEEFKTGLEKFKSNICNNLDNEQLNLGSNVVYISNITYDKLCDRLTELLRLMETKKVCYLNIG